MSNNTPFRIVPVFLFLVVLLSACNGNPSLAPTATSTALPPTNTPHPPTVTSTNTATLTLIPTDTPTATITPTPTDTATITPTPTNTPFVIPENAIMIYFTQLNTGGSVACGDSLIAIYSGHVRTGNIEEDIRLALDSLFSGGSNFGSLYNAVYPNNFRVQSVDFHQGSGKATIVLTGGYVKPDDYCDSRRYRDQIWSTARRFPEVDRVTIFLDNGILLGDLLAAFTDK